MKLLISLFLLVFPLKVQSSSCGINCVTTPTCSELGYFKDITCSNGYVLCPFDTSYKWCKQYTCADGRYKDNPLTEGGWECSEVEYQGLTCYECICNAPLRCKYRKDNSGMAILSDPCCDGSYVTCQSDCPKGINLPANSMPVYDNCEACGETLTYILDFICKEGWEKDNGSCIPIPCEEGYDIAYQSVNDCQTTFDAGYTYESKSKSGNYLCGKCIAKDCPNGEVTDLVTCENLIGYENKQTGNYKGELPCYLDECVCNAPEGCQWTEENAGLAVLTDECCNGKYQTCSLNFKALEEDEIPEHADIIATEEACGKTYPTAWACKVGYVYNDDETDCVVAQCSDGSSTVPEGCGDGTGKDIGWRLSGTQTGMSREFPCYSCEKNDCFEGDTSSSIDNCPYISGSRGIEKNLNGYYNGDDACYTCKCNAPTECTWESGTEGVGTLGKICCNGLYDDCTSNCVEDKEPLHAHRTEACTGCGITVTVAWECDEGYELTSDSKGCEPAACEGFDIVGGCPKYGFCTECLSGETIKYRLDDCKIGYEKSDDATVCNIAQCSDGSSTVPEGCGNGAGKDIGWHLSGTQTGMSGEFACYSCEKNDCFEGDTSSSIDNCPYISGSRGIEKNLNGYYSGDDVCYSCNCNPPTECTWESGTEGVGTLGKICCNGYYDNCTSNCVEDKEPSHAHKTEECTGCGKTVTVAWECNEGYELTADSKGCKAAPCVGFNIVGGCPEYGICSICLSGEITKYRLDDCQVGYVKSGNVCNVAQCNTNCAISADDCGNGSGKSNGYKLTTNCNMSGPNQCKLCVALNCPTGTDTSYTSDTICDNVNKSAGWTSTATNSYNGDTRCYECVCSNPPSSCKWEQGKQGVATLSDVCCNGKYITCISDCNWIEKVPEHGEGTTQCTGCGETHYIDFRCFEGYTKNPAGTDCIVAECPVGSVTNIDKCGIKGTIGWKAGSVTGMSGEEPCYACVAKNCQRGSTNFNVSNCGYPSIEYATTVTNDYFSGDTQCYDCVCNADAYCVYDNTNKGNGTLAGLCCNGKYEECTSTCPADVNVPDYADEVTETCYYCNTSKTIIVDFTCWTGYEKSTDGKTCKPKNCPTGSATEASLCLKTGSLGYNINSTIKGYNGEKPCYQCVANGCKEGDVNSAVSTCGYLGNIGASKPETGDYDGEKKCYKCQCNSTCSWIKGSAAVGEGILSEQCCDGKYKTCTPNCEDKVTPPPNSEGIKTSCTACNGTYQVITSWECKLGYKVNSAGTGCDPLECPTNASIEYTTGEACSKANGNTIGWVATSTGYYSKGSLCYTCTCPTSIATSCKWDNSNIGTGILAGDKCCNNKYNNCTPNCKDTVDVPNNATGIYTPCTACGKSYEIITSWVCKDCYTRSGNTCNPSDCPDGYETNAANCGSTGNNGWTLNTSSTSGCSAGTKCSYCTPKNCPTGYKTAASECGSTGTKGWELGTSTNGYKGDTVCKQCKAKPCPTGWKTNAADCGTSGTAGWELGKTAHTSVSNGDTACYQCIAKNCPTTPTATSEEWTSDSACNTAKGSSYWKSSATSSYNGTLPCYQCTCAAPTTCKWNSSNIGTATLAGNKCCNGYYDNCKTACVRKDPPTNGETTAYCTGCGVTVPSAYKCKTGYQGTNCTDCTPCPSGSATTAANCGTNGANGWTVNTSSIKGYSCANACYQCVAKSCNSEYQTAASKCGSTGASGWTVDTNQKCYEGATTKYKCIANSCSTSYQTAVGNCIASGDKGYDLDKSKVCYNGNTAKYLCTADGCASGTNKSYTTAAACKTAKGYASEYGVTAVKSTTDYDGNDACYSCSCSCSAYSYNSSNIGAYGKLTGNKCCDGTSYSSCDIDTSKLPAAVTVPSVGAEPYNETFKACNNTKSTTITRGFTCKSGYVHVN